MVKFLMLSVFLVTTLFTIHNNFLSTNHQSLPENDLWKEDVLLKTTAGEDVFNKIIDIGYEIYKPLADQNNETLVINKHWSDSTVNANCSRFWGTVTINMYGGLFRREEITPDGFALVLCHELGHAYGGTPYISAWRSMSAEGQADYYGSKECHSQIMAKLNLQEFEMETQGFIEETCNELFTGEGYDYCVRGLIGGQSLGNLLATIKGEVRPDYETPDTTIVDETLLSYPETIQCRLDTYFAGVTQNKRPLCWYKPE